MQFTAGGIQLGLKAQKVVGPVAEGPRVWGVNSRGTTSAQLIQSWHGNWVGLSFYSTPADCTLLPPPHPLSVHEDSGLRGVGGDQVEFVDLHPVDLPQFTSEIVENVRFNTKNTFERSFGFLSEKRMGSSSFVVDQNEHPVWGGGWGQANSIPSPASPSPTGSWAGGEEKFWENFLKKMADQSLRKIGNAVEPTLKWEKPRSAKVGGMDGKNAGDVQDGKRGADKNQVTPPRLYAPPEAGQQRPREKKREGAEQFEREEQSKPFLAVSTGFLKNPEYVTKRYEQVEFEDLEKNPERRGFVGSRGERGQKENWQENETRSSVCVTKTAWDGENPKTPNLRSSPCGTGKTQEPHGILQWDRENPRTLTVNSVDRMQDWEEANPRTSRAPLVGGLGRTRGRANKRQRPGPPDDRERPLPPLTVVQAWLTVGGDDRTRPEDLSPPTSGVGEPSGRRWSMHGMVKMPCAFLRTDKEKFCERTLPSTAERRTRRLSPSTPEAPIGAEGAGCLGVKSPEGDGAGRILRGSGKMTPPEDAALPEGGAPNCGERLPGEGKNLRSVGSGSPYGRIAETQNERPPSCVMRKPLLRREVRPSAGSALRRRGVASIQWEGIPRSGKWRNKTKEGM